MTFEQTCARSVSPGGGKSQSAGGGRPDTYFKYEIKKIPQLQKSAGGGGGRLKVPRGG